jgi:transposase-like protein
LGFLTGTDTMPKPNKPLPDPQVIPDAQNEKRRIRSFSKSEKLRILSEADACAYGELGALLRRENIYSSQLKKWREQLAASGAEGLENTKAGRKPLREDKDIKSQYLEKEKTKLEKQLKQAKGLLELQKKAFALFEQMDSASQS